MLLRRVSLLALILLTVTAQARTAAAPVDRLLNLIKARLELAPAVARSKWNSHVPIEDKPREQAILEGLVRQSDRYGLPPALTERFFRAQIEASKQVQNDLTRRWTAERHAPFDPVPDLGRDIRPQLDALTPQLLEALQQARGVLATDEGQEILEERSQELLDSVLEEARETAVEPLRSIR